MVARELGMSPANLNNYISEIAQKLDVFGADGIIDRAFELGLLAVVDKRETTQESPSEAETAVSKSDEDEVDHSSQDRPEIAE
jgi:hypothetical protein